MTIPTPRDGASAGFEYDVESLHAADYPFSFLVRSDGTARIVTGGRIVDALTVAQKKRLVDALRRAATTIEDSYAPRVVDN